MFKKEQSEVKLFSGNSNRLLAEEIAQHLNVRLASADVDRFRDGEISVRINESVRGIDVFIVQSTHAPADNLLELLLMIDAAKRASARRVTAVIPYFGYARQDRKDQPRVPISAKLVANLITAAGADRVLTMDLHAAQIQGFFDIPLDHLYSSPIFVDFFKKLNLSDLVIVSPDVGSIKMARAFAKKMGAGLALVDKRRPKPDVAAVETIIGEVEGKNVLIRDDIVSTGGTLVEAAVALKRNGAEQIYAACTHPVLTAGAVEQLNRSPIEKVAVLNTMPVQKTDNDKLTIISAASLFAEAIRRIHLEKSVSFLFS
ncbi:MAG: ribose-phosphate pyrophosphokinase [Candidatus Latescibacteria bacterium 4484_181]|nr:MAG: ribose-phosphate pyrophosphokinase [Candidatus Latescibacteria bacterium 4484_181]RKY69616.1 MAG: ribose-phosphate diphosphokinase [Candidatus Latescibacterota bacterium]RKY73918.1 MAG: ribose-phosphate diphosphokinase [Candidatus Latescibacterota bacterium]